MKKGLLPRCVSCFSVYLYCFGFRVCSGFKHVAGRCPVLLHKGTLAQAEGALAGSDLTQWTWPGAGAQMAHTELQNNLALRNLIQHALSKRKPES